MATCKCYDLDNQQCIGGPERRECKCEGNALDCDFYEDVKEKAKKEAEAPALAEALSEVDNLEELNDELKIKLQYYKGFYDAVMALTNGK